MIRAISLFWSLYRSGALNDLAKLVTAAKSARKENDAADTTPERFLRNLDGLDLRGIRALERLKFPSMMTAEEMLRRHDRANWEGTHVQIRYFAAKLIEAARQQGIPLYVHSARRTKAEQDKLVHEGRSRTLYPHAAHCNGEAVDIVHGKFHWELTENEWRVLGKLGKDIAERLQIPITWGGDWPTLFDPAHWEIADWRNRSRPRPDGPALRLTPRKILLDMQGYG